MTGGRYNTENEIDNLFRTATFGMRKSHKDELRRRLFSEYDELSEDEVLAAAGGNKKPDDHVDIPK